jgi:glucokinase
VAGTVIGVDVGGTKVLAGRIAADGSREAEHGVPTVTHDAEALLRQIAGVVDELRTDAVEAVGLGIPGTIDQRAGTLVMAINLPFGDVPVRDRLEELIDLPVELDNDGNCAGLAEHVHGAARGTEHSITLTLGTGVGGGVVNGGRVLRGARGAGIEVGHVVLDLHGPPCQGVCPGHGHLEAVCSGTAVGKLGREAGIGDAQAVIDAARGGDARAQSILDDTAFALGMGLVSLANAFGPEVIVIGGGFGEAACDLLIPRAQEVLRAEAMRPMNAAPVKPAELGGEAGMIGAAEIARHGTGRERR